ncbi:3'-5' exonuclease [Burkholderiaceae bacterium DAT-1]|nr:3'-5' exonuclease [Burkholderiaceae bacterium DAT-1]
MMPSLYRLLPWLSPPIRPCDWRTPLADMHWLVVDCESSGLNPRRDKLIELAAVPIEGRIIHLGRAMEHVLRQDSTSSIANILIHGISGRRQLDGDAPELVMQTFAAKLDGVVVAGFHAAFDRELCKRALHRYTLKRLTGRWLDLADLAPAICPEHALTCHTLDDWLAALNIRVAHRHTAAGDALATAQLMQTLIARVPPESSAKDLFKLAAAHRELALQRSVLR